jgi:hypothetical protein
MAIALVVLGLGVSLWRLSRSIDHLHANGASLWESQKSGAARLDRLESRLIADRTARPAPPPSVEPAPPQHQPALDDITARIESMLVTAQRAVADHVRDSIRKELLAQQDEAEHRYMLMTDLITALRSEVAEVRQIVEARDAAPSKRSKT